ncbi:MAG: aminopeptidase P family protein [Candidatus Rokubacteria bacterium]|nr:aminopeptidase P family protein [Candidatus Rokubacteria bacterium]
MAAQSFDFRSRWARAASVMERHGVDALFLMKPANLAYLTGDGRPCALGLLTRAGRCVVAVPASDLPSVRRASAATDIRAFRSEEEMFHGFRDVLAEHGLSEATVALEKNFFDAALYEVFTAHILPKARVVPAAPILSRLRMLKEVPEIECLQAAAAVADAGMAAAAGALRPGMRETDVAGEAERAMRKAGAEGWASPTYVASGWRSAMAHGPASLKPIEAGEAVQVHVAPVARGYTVDLCRTILVGQVTQEMAEAMEAYRDAQERGIAAAVPEAPLVGVDAAMATALGRRGLEDAFLRPVFHGVGIEHEEAPIPGGHAVIHGEEKVERVAAGMVLAIGNCGIYRESFGVRLEDTVWVSQQGPVPLTRYPKLLRA